VRVYIDMSAGELEMKSGGTTLFEGDFDFNIPLLKPVLAYAVDGTTGALKLSQGSASGNYENRWRLSVDETTPVDLHVSLGAGDAQLVLGRVTLRSLSVSLGAGDLVLDLRGTPARSYIVSVVAGAGDTTIHLPASVGISARTSGLIGDANISGLEKRDGRWINARAEGSPVTVDLEVKHAIGDLRLLAE
jgi:predicted membrane protein